jgi:NAD(P)-dependent dehydrogenase (short-subunit alcohol dehydrogenase family)
VKLLSADDSVGLPHAKVGHCQVFIQTPAKLICGGFLFLAPHFLSACHGTAKAVLIQSMNVFITGANRGLGLGLVNHYLAQGDEVWACYRFDQGGLYTLENDRLHRLAWDVREEAPRTSGGLPERIDLLINNAGIYGPKNGDQSLEQVSAQAMQEVFDVDCVGALRVVQYLLPRLVKARGVIANISSKMGSSGDNASGGSYAYRSGKAALVILSKSMAVDLAPRGVRVITLHPGWVRTDMTDHSGLIDVEESVRGMAAVIEQIDTYPAGAFVAFDGKEVPY